MDRVRMGTWRLGGIGLFVAIVLIAATAIAALTGVARFAEATAKVEAAYEELDAYSSLLRNINELQASTMIYVATSNPGELDAMRRSEHAITRDIARLFVLEQSDAEHLRYVQELQPQCAGLIEACRATAAATLLRGRLAGVEALRVQKVADRAVAVTASIERASANERQILRQRHDLQRRVAEEAVLPVGVISVLALAVAMASALALYRDNRLRRRAETRFRALLESAPDAMLIIDQLGRISEVNAQVEAVFGWMGGELVGRSVDVLVPDSVNATYPGVLAAYLADPKALPFGACQQLVGLRKDRSEVPVELSLSPLPTGTSDAFVVAVRDITARRAAAAELDRIHGEYADLYDNAPCWYQSVASDGRVLRINETGLRWLGFARSEVVGHPFTTFMTSAARDKVIGVMKQFTDSGRIADVELEYVRKDGGILPVLVNGIAVHDADGKIMLARTTMVDLTELKRTREERERVIDKLQDTLAQVKTLRGLLPVCAWCKRIRDDAGYYHTLESFIASHSDTQFTHAICPDCQRDLEGGTPP